MKPMKIVAALLSMAAAAFGAGGTPIKNGYLQSDFNLSGYSMSNGNFIGNASGLTNLPVSAYTNIFTGVGTTGSVTATVADLGKVLRANGDWVPLFGGGDFMADGSVPMSGPLNLGGQGITNGFLIDSYGTNSVNWQLRYLYDSHTNIVASWEGLVLGDTGGNTSIDWGARTLCSTSSTVKVDWESSILSVSTGVPSVDWFAKYLYDGSGTFISVDWNSRYLIDDNGTTLSVDWGDRLLWDGTPTNSIDWANRYLYDNTGLAISADWQNRYLYASGGTNISVDWSNRYLYDASGTVMAADWANRYLYDNNIAGPSISIDWANRYLYDGSGSITTIDWNNRYLYDGSGSILSVDWGNRILVDAVSDTVVDWSSGNLDIRGNAVSNMIPSVVSTKEGTNTLVVAQSSETFTSTNAAGNVQFDLPSVDATNLGVQYTFCKLGAGTLTVDAADSDTIADSGAGDTIYNNTAGETYATLTLRLVSETQWVIIGGHGTWTTTD